VNGKKGGKNPFDGTPQSQLEGEDDKRGNNGKTPGTFSILANRVEQKKNIPKLGGQPNTQVLGAME